jgi:hypothetical protein
MTPSLLIALIVFVALTAIAMVAQAIAVLGMVRVARQTQEKVNSFLPEAAKVLDSAQRAIDQTTKFLNDANTRTADILDATKTQLAKLDTVLTDATTRAQTQMDRVELVLDDAMSRTQHTVAVLQKGVLSPIREVNGMLTGLRTAIMTLARGSRPTVDHATADEEMFI